MENAKQIRACAYARTSTVLAQDPELQLVAIREYAARNNIVIVTEFVDQVSGSTSSRPSLDKMVRRIRNKEFDAVIVTALDRLGRSSAHLLGLVPLFRDNNCTLISMRESISLDSPAGRAFFGMLSILAELDRENISERIKVALRSKALIAKQTGSGWRCGRPIVVTPEVEAQVLRLRAEGVSIRQIERQLDRRVSRSSIERILKRGKS
jgi:DNA invertase Pin-like site-specific DNA recombinase